MSSSYFKLSKPLRTRLQQELQPGETVIWAGTPDWRATWGNLLFSSLFAVGWTAITGFFAVMIAAAAFGFIPWKMNGSTGSRGWAFVFLAFITPFAAIGVVLLLQLLRDLRSGSRRVHAITDRRILTVELGHAKPIDDRPRSSINFVRTCERADGNGTIAIACGVERDADGSPRPETIIWPGIPDVAFVQATLDRRTAPTVSATQRAPEQGVVPAILSDLPAPLARAAERETRGERIAWIGRPDGWTAAKWSTLIWIFALPWLYFTVRWEGASLAALIQKLATGAIPSFSLIAIALWGLPFAGVGLAMFATPLWVWRWGKSTVHIITDRRILSIRRQRGRIAVASIEPSRIVSVTRSGEPARGTLRIVLGKTTDSDGDETDLVETFWLVEDAERAEQLIQALRAHDDRRAA